MASANDTCTKGSPARILVVEDEALVAMLIEDELTDLGFDVVGPAATAARALELCRDERIDGAVLDVNLGGGQRSDSVADFLLSKRIPFVFVTGYGDAGVSARFADKAVLQKPFALPDLRGLVEQNFEPLDASRKSARRAASG